MTLIKRTKSGSNVQGLCGQHMVINTQKYFHSQATQHFRKNHVAQIHTSSGVSSMNMEVSTSFINYFNDHFSSASPTHCEETVGSIHSFISPEMNRKLCAGFMAREVHNAI